MPHQLGRLTLWQIREVYLVTTKTDGAIDMDEIWAETAKSRR